MAYPKNTALRAGILTATQRNAAQILVRRVRIGRRLAPAPAKKG